MFDCLSHPFDKPVWSCHSVGRKRGGCPTTPHWFRVFILTPSGRVGCNSIRLTRVVPTSVCQSCSVIQLDLGGWSLSVSMADGRNSSGSGGSRHVKLHDWPQLRTRPFEHPGVSTWFAVINRIARTGMDIFRVLSSLEVYGYGIQIKIILLCTSESMNLSMGQLSSWKRQWSSSSPSDQIGKRLACRSSARGLFIPRDEAAAKTTDDTGVVKSRRKKTPRECSIGISQGKMLRSWGPNVWEKDDQIMHPLEKLAQKRNPPSPSPCHADWIGGEEWECASCCGWMC